MKVTIEVKEAEVTRKVRVQAGSISRALTLAGGGRPGARARVLFPIAPEEFFPGGFEPGGVSPENVEPVLEAEEVAV
jgi:hypothetical protein